MYGYEHIRLGPVNVVAFVEFVGQTEHLVGVVEVTVEDVCCISVIFHAVRMSERHNVIVFRFDVFDVSPFFQVNDDGGCYSVAVTRYRSISR